jgi:hypothetical protein
VPLQACLEIAVGIRKSQAARSQIIVNAHRIPVSLPAPMTHASTLREVRAALGITDRLVRISVGIEDDDDLIADLKVALGWRSCDLFRQLVPQRRAGTFLIELDKISSDLLILAVERGASQFVHQHPGVLGVVTHRSLKFCEIQVDLIARHAELHDRMSQSPGRWL